MCNAFPTGKRIKQYDICANLGLSSTVGAEKLNEMGKEGLIIRKWDNDEYTFMINKT